MKTYLEYKDEKSHKFWQIEQKGKTNTVCYGKVGSDGRESIKEFDSEEVAKKDAQKQINSKKKKGYIEAKPPKVERKTVKIRQPLLENPLYEFEYEQNPPKNPTGVFMSFDEANEKYKIEGGQLEYFVTSAFVLDGDVHIKNEEESKKIISQAHQNDSSTLIVITGNLTYEGFVGDSFQPLMVCGDVKCNGIFTDEADITIKGNIYAKHAFSHAGSDCCFACFGEILTPYFLTNNIDENLNITFLKRVISINYEPEMYDSESDFKCDYNAKNYAKVMEYDVLDFGFELDVKSFINYVASGKNPIRKFERTKKEIAQDKNSKANDSLTHKIKNSTTKLDLSYLELKLLPENVCKLSHLEVLDLTGNKIKKLPKEIKSLTSLKKLILDHNNTINIDAICELENLEVLNINGCAWAWTSDKPFVLPKDFGRLKNLKTLMAYVGNAHFANPQMIADLQNLENLEIAHYYLLDDNENYILGMKDKKSLKRLKIRGDLYKQTKMKLKNDYAQCEKIFFEK